MDRTVDFKQGKINLIKEMAAGLIEPEVAKYIFELLKHPGDYHRIFFYDEKTNEISPDDKVAKELQDKLPEKYKNIFTYSLLPESFRSVGDEV